MSAITKRLISDIVLFRLQGGFPNVAGTVQKQDVWIAIDQWINNRFKLQQFNTNLPSGETIPDGLAMATYTDVSIISSRGVATALLPIIPISLPKNVGIFNIQTAASLGASVPKLDFIPLLRGQYALLSTDKLLNDLLGQVGYTPSNNSVTFTSDITLYGVTKVDMDLIVFDISKYSETDILPVPADFQNDMVVDIYNMFAPIKTQAGIVNNYPIPNQL